MVLFRLWFLSLPVRFGVRQCPSAVGSSRFVGVGSERSHWRIAIKPCRFIRRSRFHCHPVTECRSARTDPRKLVSFNCIISVFCPCPKTTFSSDLVLEWHNHHCFFAVTDKLYDLGTSSRWCFGMGKMPPLVRISGSINRPLSDVLINWGIGRNHRLLNPVSSNPIVAKGSGNGHLPAEWAACDYCHHSTRLFRVAYGGGVQSELTARVHDVTGVEVTFQRPQYGHLVRSEMPLHPRADHLANAVVMT
jgi:hypothetical protein